MGSTQWRRGRHDQRSRCLLSWRKQIGMARTSLQLRRKIVVPTLSRRVCGKMFPWRSPLTPPFRFWKPVMVANIRAWHTSSGTWPRAKSSAACNSKESVSASFKQVRTFVQPPGPGATPEGAPSKQEWKIFRSIVRGVSGSNSNTASGIGRNYMPPLSTHVVRGRSGHVGCVTEQPALGVSVLPLL